MLDLPIGPDAPARDAVVVLVREGEGGRHRLFGLTAGGDEVGAERLDVAGFVPGPALQHDRLAVPAPRHAEARERLWQHRVLQRSLCPALAAVGRDHDLGDAAVARIGHAGDVVVARPLQAVAERRMRNERLHLLGEVEQPALAARQDLRIGLRLEEAHRRLVDELDPPHVLDVHVALIAGQQQAHRIAVAGHQPLAVLIEHDDGVIERLLHRHAAVQAERVRPLGKEPLRFRIDAGFFQERRKRHAGPFGVGDEAVQRLRGDLQRFAGEHRRRIAAALEERHARHQRIARQRIDGEHQGLFHQTVDDQLVLRRVDIRQAGMRDGEEQSVRRHRALQQMMRRASMRVAKLVVGIAERAHDVLLKSRRHLIGRHDGAHFQAPRVVLERLGGRAGERDAGRHRAGDHGAASQQGPAIEQTVAGNLFDLLNR